MNENTITEMLESDFELESEYVNSDDYPDWEVEIQSTSKSYNIIF